MMPAAKHGDPQLGVDIHLCVVPPSPSPVPLPTPHMSVVFDPMDYLPFIGATVTVCGMKRAVAGTSGTAVHIPPGFPFAPKLPDKDDEIFMGSATVVADGDPFSFLGVPVLACQVAGMPSPPRPRRKGGPRVMLLPTVFNLAIPSTVFVGGPPTISLMGMAFKLGFAGLGRLAKSRFAKALGARFRAWRKAKFGHLKPGFLKCKILRAEPVNIVTGAVSVEHEDFVLANRIPLRWVRRYASNNARRGACGMGWETPADARLEHDLESGVVLFHHPESGIAIFPGMPDGSGSGGEVLELMDGARLSDEGEAFLVRTKEDRAYRFPKSLLRRAADGALEYPLGMIEDFCGNILIYERDRATRVVAIRGGPGARLVFGHDDAGFIRQILLEDQQTGLRHTFIEYEQDGAGDLTEVRDALGTPYRFAYDAHQMVRHTNRNGLSFHYAFEDAPEGRRVVRAWGDGGLHAYHFAYLDAVNERRITDSLGHVSVVTLDERGLPVSEIDPIGGKTVFEYDEAGRTVAVIDQDGQRTEYAYDTRGNLTKLTRPDGSAVETEFNEADKAVRVVDPNGAVWRQEWDDRNLLAAQIAPLGAVVRYDYDTAGQLRALHGPAGVRTSFEWDQTGGLLAATDALGAVTRWQRDALGQVVAHTDALGVTTIYRRDAKGRVVEVALPGDARIACAYDGEDNITSFVDENGAETRSTYAGLGSLIERIHPDDSSVRYLYDSEEELIGLQNERGEIHRIRRDALGRIVEETDYWGQSRRYAYSAAGWLRASIDPLDRRVTYETDALGRIVKSVFVAPEEGGTAWEESYGYDANGNLVACANPDIAVTRVYDAQNNLVEERQGEALLLTNSFDRVGNRIERRAEIHAGGQVSVTAITYTHDARGDVVGIAIDDAPCLAIERDKMGQAIAERFGPVLMRRTRYDAAGRIGHARIDSRQNAGILDIAYRYDGAGNLIERRDARTGIDRFSYDRLGRLLAHADPAGGTIRFLPDAAGDAMLTRILAGSDGWSRVGEHIGARYSFDRAGDLVEREDQGSALRLRWDARRRLVEAARDGRTTRYVYDPLGRRVAKHGPKGTSLFFWDGTALMATHRLAREGTVADRHLYVHRDASHVPLLQVSAAGDGTSSCRLVHAEPNGAAAALIDMDGHISWSCRYTPSGRAITSDAAGAECEWRLENQQFDEETSLHYNYFRYFDPALGGFVSADPIGLRGGSNLYCYGPHSIGWSDPLGLAAKYTKLADPNPIPASIRNQYENIKLGGGVPRIDPATGQQTIFMARSMAGRRDADQWRGSREWDVPGTSHRILERPDGKLGYVLDHRYDSPFLFPAPWYPEGGVVPKRLGGP
jgi:RHS repeat-associated protein